MIRRCSCILLAELRTLQPHHDIAILAGDVAQYESQSRSVGEIVVMIDHMIDAGSRYMNLEKALGLGASLVLGNHYSETLFAAPFASYQNLSPS